MKENFAKKYPKIPGTKNLEMPLFLHRFCSKFNISKYHTEPNLFQHPVKLFYTQAAQYLRDQVQDNDVSLVQFCGLFKLYWVGWVKIR